MSSGSDIDIRQTEAAFAAAYAQLLAAKTNTDELGEVTSYDEGDADERAVAQWGDWQDDAAITYQRTARFHFRGTGAPALVAPIGSIYHRENGGAGSALYVKESDAAGTGGWVALGGTDGVIYEVNFADIADLALTDGGPGFELDGLTWTGSSLTTELDTPRIESGTGIVLAAPVSGGGASTFTSASQAAPHLWLPLSSIPGFDPTADLVVEIYFSSLTLEANGEGVFAALHATALDPHSSSTSRVRLAGLYRNAGGDRVVRSTSNTSISDGTAALPSANVLGMRMGANGLGLAYSGQWADGWPRARASMNLATSLPAADPMLTDATRLCLGLSVANDASPTTAVAIERLRVRRVG